MASFLPHDWQNNPSLCSISNEHDIDRTSNPNLPAFLFCVLAECSLNVIFQKETSVPLVYIAVFLGGSLVKSTACSTQYLVSCPFHRLLQFCQSGSRHSSSVGWKLAFTACYLLYREILSVRNQILHVLLSHLSGAPSV